MTFKASYEKTFELSIDIEKAKDLSRKIILLLDWNFISENQNKMISKIKANIWSYGEELSLEFSHGQMKIKSSCSFPLQLFDWGKNKSNVKKFYNIYELIVNELNC